MFLSAAYFVEQQDLSTEFVKRIVPADPSSHAMHADESVYFIIGQEATTIGKPMLNTVKIVANVSPIMRYLRIDIICLIEPTCFLLRSLSP